eukprot:15443178-Alexandrium_andersonii.AAC.1
MAFAEVAILKCGNIDPPSYDLPDALHDSEHWWSDFFTLACGALRGCDTAAREWISESMELDYVQLADVPS